MKREACIFTFNESKIFVSYRNIWAKIYICNAFS
ncbi:hypothetical protein FUSO5_11585 [Fusobacterium necrophorum BFTR-1]|nr:hypothetical protein FUSO5_11585 [Fusobacterium necrophorum BFTR-1]